MNAVCNIYEKASNFKDSDFEDEIFKKIEDAEVVDYGPPNDEPPWLETEAEEAKSEFEKMIFQAVEIAPPAPLLQQQQQQREFGEEWFSISAGRLLYHKQKKRADIN